MNAAKSPHRQPPAGAPPRRGSLLPQSKAHARSCCRFKNHAQFNSRRRLTCPPASATHLCRVPTLDDKGYLGYHAGRPVQCRSASLVIDASVLAHRWLVWHVKKKNIRHAPCPERDRMIATTRYAMSTDGVVDLLVFSHLCACMCSS